MNSRFVQSRERAADTVVKIVPIPANRRRTEMGEIIIRTGSLDMYNGAHVAATFGDGQEGE